MSTKISSPSARVGRPIAALALATATLFAVSACSGAASTEADGETTLTVQISAEWGPMMDILVSTFEAENPGVTVELQTITPEQKSTTNSQLISSSNPPDVAQASGDWRDLARNGDLEPLDDIFEEIAPRLTEGTAEQLQVDGTYYGVPTGNAYVGMAYYNVELFEEAGIEIPADRRIASNADLYDIVNKLKAVGAEGVAIGGTGGYQFGWLVDGLLASATSEEELAGFLSSADPSADLDVSYTDPAFVQSLETLKAWGDNGVFQEGYLGADPAQASALYYQGIAGMILGGSWYVGQFEENNLEFTSDFLILPPVDGAEDSKMLLITGTSMVVPSAGANVELAKKFVELWQSDEMQLQAVANTNFSFPNVTTVDLSALTIAPLGAAIVEQASSAGTFPMWSAVVPGPVGQQVIDPNVQGMLAGASTPQEVAAKQQTAIEGAR